MQTITQHYTATLEVKQSKFIAHLVPYELYETTLQQLQQEHPKARHFVTAYRYLNQFSQIVEHSSDDGEPKGTSGKPSLMVLQGQDLINVGVIVVRYFGGTKLGTGGLVRAYSDAVNLVLGEAELIEYKEQTKVRFEVPYSDVRFIDYECEHAGVRIVQKDFENVVVYSVEAPKEDLEAFLQKVTRVITRK